MYLISSTEHFLLAGRLISNFPSIRPETKGSCEPENGLPNAESQVEKPVGYTTFIKEMGLDDTAITGTVGKKNHP